MSPTPTEIAGIRALRRILVVQTAYLGDVVLTTGLLREIRRRHPRARLTVLTNETGREVLSAQPEIDEFLVLDKRWNGPGTRSWVSIARQLFKEPFDAAVAAQRSFRTGLCLGLSRAALRIGFSGAPGAWAYNRKVAWDVRHHAARRLLDLSTPLGGDPESADPSPRLKVADSAAARAPELLARAGVEAGLPLVAVAPGSARVTKQWTPEGYARVVSGSLARGYAVVMIGSVADRELCREIAGRVGPGVPVLAGRTRVSDLVAVLSRCAALVGNDSGPAHVASAVGVPVVQIFGPTAPRDGFAAFGNRTRVVQHPSLACRPCSRRGPRRCPRGHFRCMLEIPADRVIEGLFDLIEHPADAPIDPRIAATGAGV